MHRLDSPPTLSLSPSLSLSVGWILVEYSKQEFDTQLSHSRTITCSTTTFGINLHPDLRKSTSYRNREYASTPLREKKRSVSKSNRMLLHFQAETPRDRVISRTRTERARSWSLIDFLHFLCWNAGKPKGSRNLNTEPSVSVARFHYLNAGNTKKLPLVQKEHFNSMLKPASVCVHEPRTDRRAIYIKSTGLKILRASRPGNFTTRRKISRPASYRDKVVEFSTRYSLAGTFPYISEKRGERLARLCRRSPHGAY